jgi:hypothetical protein
MSTSKTTSPFLLPSMEEFKKMPGIVEANDSISNVPVKKLSRNHQAMPNDYNFSHGILKVKTANEWITLAKSKAIPKMLFGELWREGELCFLFADTNVGKSILAVQIGNSISKGEPILNFPLEASKQPVLYFDFELSEKQFENRYSVEYAQHYDFDENFKRVTLDTTNLIPTGESFESQLYRSLENTIRQTGAKVLIIDNLTYLNDGTENAKDASPLMKKLKVLKENYGLSLLVLAHTPKRNKSNPITDNDLQGSRMLMNFADSSFAIGQSSKESNLRYIKQMKERNSGKVYDANNVCVLKVCKPHNFLKFEFVETDSERNHLKISQDDKEHLISQVKALHAQGKSVREIKRELNMRSVGTVQNYITK